MALNHETLTHGGPVQPENPTKHHQTLQDTTKSMPGVEDAKCKCCGMSEECTPEYVSHVREDFSGKMVCGVCSEAVEEEAERNGGRRDKALQDHVIACVRFNKIGRAYPLLLQAEDVNKILKNKRSLCPNSLGFGRSNPLIMNPREKGTPIARSSSCIPSITK